MTDEQILQKEVEEPEIEEIEGEFIKEITEPEIEHEEVDIYDLKDTNENKLDSTECKFIEQDPHNYICCALEESYIHMGRRIMEYLSLVPCSLVLPKFIDVNGKETIARISIMVISNPGTGKTSISDYFKSLALNPFPFEYITDSKLASVLQGKDKVTVITSDIARIFRDPFLSKLVENIIGDEGKLSRFTQKTKNTEEHKIDAVSYFAGTPANLYTTISDGLIFRVSPLVIFHTLKEQEEILKKMNQMVGNSNGNKIVNKLDIIKAYYQRLYNIQEGIGEKPKIEGCIIPEYFRQEIESKLIPLFIKSAKSTEFEFNRELNQCYKYMVSHAFLNVFNRKVIDGKLILEDKDLRIALYLSEKEVKMKVAILRCINLISERKLRTLMDLDEYVKKYEYAYDKSKSQFVKVREFPHLNYMILKSIIRNR